MEDFIFDNNKNGITKRDILYSGLYAVLISFIIVFGCVLVLGIDVAYCNHTRLAISYFIVLITSWAILLIRRC
ncbi:MAG: hypothetical protein K5644_02690 [Lachnospiraceae bacterium]|nr:hypothetical protein [Lachnospiraceae bacterium]